MIIWFSITEFQESRYKLRYDFKKMMKFVGLLIRYIFLLEAFYTDINIFRRRIKIEKIGVTIFRLGGGV